LNEIVVNTYDEYLSIIDKYNRNNDLPRNTQMGMLQTFYRGQSNKNWIIEPSINRSGKRERDILGEIKINAGESLFQVMARVQHYKEAKTREKVGTRLIDFTKSVDVALYFACCEEDNDGAVFVQSIVPHKEEWYTVHILLEIANLESEKVNVRELTDILWSKYSLFSERFEDKGMVDNAITALIDFGIMIIPEKETLIQNKRMCAQEGCLWICGNRLDDRNQIRTSLTSKSMYFYPNDYCVPEWFCDHRDLLKIVIPKRKKEEFLCKLSDKNISRESLFPD
jgi:hypothetical protein